MPKPQQSVYVLQPDRGHRWDHVAEETPVAFEYNGISHAVMLATPTDLEDLAIGFSMSEGIIERPADLFGVDCNETQQGITLQIEIASVAFARLKEYRRNLTGRTGCGLCGTESLDRVQRPVAPVATLRTFPLSMLYHGLSELPRLQALQQVTGATHAAAHVDAQGQLSCVREDVGRHNALDKTLGALTRSVHSKEGALIITSRASFEMVQKTAALGYGLLAAVSAPTAAAIRLAQKLNVALIGFMRQQQCVIYAHAEHIQLHSSDAETLHYEVAG